jgi:high-affinity Fe2+/Pb2+ permease
MFDGFFLYTKYQGLLKRISRVLLYFGYTIQVVVFLAFSLGPFKIGVPKTKMDSMTSVKLFFANNIYLKLI